MYQNIHLCIPIEYIKNTAALTKTLDAWSKMESVSDRQCPMRRTAHVKTHHTGQGIGTLDNRET